MMSMKSKAWALGPILIALSLCAPIAYADGGAPARIREVRVGSHDGYDRLVIEIDNEVDVLWENGPEPGEESFYIAAAPAQTSRVIKTQLPRMGTVSVTQMKGGTHIAVEPRERTVRAYTLANPPRLVVDFAPPGTTPFTAPADARALEPAKTLGPLVIAPEPGATPPAPEAQPEAKAPEPGLAPEAKAEAEPAPEDTSLGDAAPPPEVEPLAEVAPEPDVEPAPEVAPEPTPSVVEPPAPAPPKAKPAPTPVPTAKPTPAAASSESAFPWGLALAALLGLLLLVAAIVFIARRRAAASEPPIVIFPPTEDAYAAEDDLPEAVPADDILPGEIVAASEHEAALEKRLDEEVRARVELEQRMAGANEELKVLRDRLHRLETRRREGSV
jgi:hypothetical protein